MLRVVKETKGYTCEFWNFETISCINSGIFRAGSNLNYVDNLYLFRSKTQPSFNELSKDLPLPSLCAEFLLLTGGIRRKGFNFLGSLCGGRLGKMHISAGEMNRSLIRPGSEPMTDQSHKSTQV